MEITVAKHAGFCFGVKRATDRLEQAIADRRAGERIFTLGTLIHNDVYNQMLYDQGVRVIDIGEVEMLAAESAPEAPVTVFIRAHGIPRGDEEQLKHLCARYPYFRYEDCTCPFVNSLAKIPYFTDEIISSSVVLPPSMYVALIRGIGIYLKDSLRPLPVGATP